MRIVDNDEEYDKPTSITTKVEMTSESVEKVLLEHFGYFPTQ